MQGWCLALWGNSGPLEQVFRMTVLVAVLDSRAALR